MSDRRFEYCQAILSKLKNGEKHNKRTIEKLAAEFTIYNKNLVKEMTELAVVLIAREISNNSRFTNYEKYQQIVELYYQQVNLSHRTSHQHYFSNTQHRHPLVMLRAYMCIRITLNQACILNPLPAMGF